MKLLLTLATLALPLAHAVAANLKIDGDLTWQITEPYCSFNMDGGIQNLSPSGSSGTIKLVLWATPAAFPSAGYNVGEVTLGQINAGYQFSDFTIRTASKLPNISGTYHFSIAVLEFTTAGWRTRTYATTGTRTLKAGDLANQTKWKQPAAAISTPAAALKPANLLTLTPRATSELNALPAAATEPFTVLFNKSKVTVTRPDEKNPAIAKYAIKKATYNKKSVPVGQLVLDYKAAGKKSSISKGTVVLYFQSPTSGFYSNSEADSFGSYNTWGTFTLK